MASEAIKLKKLELKIQREKMLYDLGVRTLDNVTALAHIDGLALIGTWLLVEWAQNSRAPWADPLLPDNDPAAHYIGPIAAGTMQAAIAAGFALNGFGQSGLAKMVK